MEEEHKGDGDLSFVSIVIPAFNEEEFITACLESIFRSSYPRDKYEVILVDNYSQDKTVEKASEFKVKILIEKKRGQPYARNLGVDNAKGDIIVFLDADTIVSKHWLRNLVNIFDSKDVGGAGGAVQPLTKTIISRYLGYSLFERYNISKNKREIRGSLQGCNMAVRRELFIKFGKFELDSVGDRDPGDKDICFRITKHGYKLIYDPSAVIYHNNPYTIHLLMRKWWKSASSRVPLSEQYPFKADSIMFKLYLPILYLPLIIFLNFYYSLFFYIFIAIPVLILFIGSLNAFRDNKDFFLSFIIKPMLDALSIFVISIAFFYYKHVKHEYKKAYLDLLDIKK